MEIGDYSKTEAKSRQLEGELREETLKSSRIESLVRVHRNSYEQKESTFKRLKEKLLVQKKDESPRQKFEAAKRVCKQMISAKKAATEEKCVLLGVEQKKKGSDALLGLKKKQLEILQKALTEGKRLLAGRKEETAFQAELDSIISSRVKTSIFSTSSKKDEISLNSETDMVSAKKIKTDEVEEKVRETGSGLLFREELQELSMRELQQDHGFNQHESGQRQQEQGARNLISTYKELEATFSQEYSGKENFQNFYKQASEELREQIEKLQTWKDGKGAGVELSYTTRSGHKLVLEVRQDALKGFSVTIVPERSHETWSLRADRQIIYQALQDAGLKVSKVEVIGQGAYRERSKK